MATERLSELYARNDQIERELAKIDRHGRRESYSDAEVIRKHELQNELNNTISEIESLEDDHLND